MYRRLLGSITVAAPLDVIKTRIQSRPFDSPESGATVVRKLLATEGPGAFFKGLVRVGLRVEGCGGVGGGGGDTRFRAYL